MTVESKASNEPQLVHPDSDELSRRLQAHGITLPRVAVSMLGYQAIAGYDANEAKPTGETYLLPRHGEGIVSVVPDSEKGIQIAEVTYGLNGQHAFNMVDFVMAHRPDLFNSPLEAAKAVCTAFLNEERPDVVAPVVVQPPKEMDVTYAFSAVLQKKGFSLTYIAQRMFGFDVTRSEGEAYLFDQGRMVASVVPNSAGLEIARYTEPVNGRSSVCAVRFAMDHGGYRDPLTANDAVLDRFISRPVAPKAA